MLLLYIVPCYGLNSCLFCTPYLVRESLSASVAPGAVLFEVSSC